MTAFMSLLRLQFKQQFRPARGRRFGSAALIIVPLAFIPLFALLTTFCDAITAVGATMGAPGVGIELAVLAAMLAGVLFGLSYIISSFYYSADLQLLVPLPIKPESVLYAKFVLLMLNEIVSMSILYLPAIVGYALVMHPGVAFWIIALALLLVLPAIPLGIAALLAMGLMALTNGRVNRDALRVAFSVFFILIWVGFQSLSRYWGMSNFGSGMSPEGIAMMQGFLRNGGLLDLIGRFFPPSLWVTRGITGDLPSLLLFFVVTLATGVILAAAARRWFYRGLVGGDERRRSNRPVTAERLQTTIGRANSPAVAVFLREVRQFNRTPVFLMQGLTPALMAPIYFVIPLVNQGGLAAIRAIAANGLSPWLILGAVAMMQFLLSLTPIAATAFSREGGHFWMSRALPLSGRDQVRGKLLHVLTVAAIYIIVFGGILTVLFRPDLLQVLLFFVANLLGAAISGAIGLRMDLAAPRLNWTDPQQAFKGNYNGMFTMLLFAVILLPIGGLTAFLLRFGEPLAYLGAVVLLATAAVISYREALRFADTAYERIEL